MDSFIVEHLQLYRKLKTIYTFFYLIIQLFILVNLFACIYYMVGKYSIDEGMKSWLTEE